ncbi:unnamed protein product [Gadus morhua 'NCC']
MHRSLSQSGGSEPRGRDTLLTDCFIFRFYHQTNTEPRQPLWSLRGQSLGTVGICFLRWCYERDRGRASSRTPAPALKSGCDFNKPLQGPDVSPLADYSHSRGQMCPHWLTTATPGARCVPTG